MVGGKGEAADRHVDEEFGLDDRDTIDEDEEDALVVAMTNSSAQETADDDDDYGTPTDPCRCFCWCNYRKIGFAAFMWTASAQTSFHRQSYVVREARPFILVGPHWIGVLVTLSLILASTILFIGQQCAELEAWYTVASLGMASATTYFLFKTTCTDPGIVPRGTTQTDPAVVATCSYCDICDVHQFRGTEHCDDCGVCIEKYDHHCPWMGKCIGKKNMKWFQLFNLAWILYLVFVLTVTMQNASANFVRDHVAH
ncbi:dhhc zinc finger domain-containing protein [Achlya hypogyna]|uniref:Palmitoyltransferase n=1 Tax=Achlya hypogyna TaxID=1202772 RepID=A0A1V9ZGY0_ACHHY|nr:dhhc zinc finger domain-containing protein [Achlya hypogyna]